MTQRKHLLGRAPDAGLRRLGKILETVVRRLDRMRKPGSQ